MTVCPVEIMQKEFPGEREMVVKGIKKRASQVKNGRSRPKKMVVLSKKNGRPRWSSQVKNGRPRYKTVVPGQNICLPKYRKWSSQVKKSSF
jgi:hypothetical protein